MVEFPYIRERSRLLGEVIRPVATLEVRSARSNWIPVIMYIDSGADITLVPRGLGQLLRLDLRRNRGNIAGVGGGTVSVSLQRVEMKLADWVFVARIGFALTEQVPYLLGRYEVFRLFRIVFEEFRKVVSFEQPAKKR